MNKEKIHPKRYLVELSQNHMNTTFRFQVSVPETLVEFADHTLSGIHQEIIALENKISEFKAESDLFRLKNARAGESVRVESEIIELLETSASVAAWSENAFNVAFRSPSGGLHENYSWDQNQRTVMKLQADSLLGFGAIGKGYALDFAAQKLLSVGLNHFYLEAGGSSLIFCGEENQQVPWKMAFAWEKRGDEYLGQVFEVSPAPLASQLLCVGVSGNLEQGEHIVRRNRVNSSENLLNKKSITQLLVTAQTAARADAFSTALFANPTLTEKYIEGALLFVDTEGVLIANPNFKNAFQ